MTPEEMLEHKLARQAETQRAIRDAKSDRERDEQAALYALLTRDTTTLGNAPSDIAKLDAQIAPLTAALDRLRAAETTLLAQLHDDDLEPLTRTTVAASVRTLRSGAGFVDGEPLLPTPLRDLLTDTCETCGHQTLQWFGPVFAIEEKLKTLERKRRLIESALHIAMTPREVVAST